MTGSTSRHWLLPVGLAVGVPVLVWAATTGPPEVIGPSTRAVRPPSYSPRISESPSASPGPSLEELLKGRPRTHDLSWIGDLVSWTVLLGLLLVVLFGTAWLWRHRWRPPPRPQGEEVEPLPDVAAVSEALVRDAAAQRAAVREGSPRNGIVRCWLRLEEIIADAGLPRAPWETSAEFTVRVLHTLDLDPRAIGSLAALYREARFSEHELGEEARQAAGSALDMLHADLRALELPGVEP